MPQYDFFISYKHAVHTREAHEIKRILTDRGYASWIDTEQSLDVMSAKRLAEHLRQALETCTYVVFFETYAQIAKQIGGPDVRVHSWQERELEMADVERIVTLHHSQSKLAFGKSQWFTSYGNLGEAVEAIEDWIKYGIVDD